MNHKALSYPIDNARGTGIVRVQPAAQAWIISEHLRAHDFIRSGLGIVQLRGIGRNDLVAQAVSFDGIRNSDQVLPVAENRATPASFRPALALAPRPFCNLGAKLGGFGLRVTPPKTLDLFSGQLALQPNRYRTIRYGVG